MHISNSFRSKPVAESLIAIAIRAIYESGGFGLL